MHIYSNYFFFLHDICLALLIKKNCLTSTTEKARQFMNISSLTGKDFPPVRLGYS